MSEFTILQGDALEKLRELPDASVDSMVTDPPAGISFMGKKWDHDHGGRDSWVKAFGVIFAEAYRVLKPGAHALVWAIPRTSHWTATALEDAGFEIRDVVLHLFGTGFPKSLDVSKSIDKRPAVARHREFADALAGARDRHGLTRADVSDAVVGTRSGACWNWEHHQFPESRHWAALSACLPSLDRKWGSILEDAEREKIGEGWRVDRKEGAVNYGSGTPDGAYDITAPATEAARTWEGWGTALKPAAEHWILCRKPLVGTVAGNVLEHGCGAINVDGCRVGTEGGRTHHTPSDGARRDRREGNTTTGETTEHGGRWPANVVLSHDDCDEGCTPDCPVRMLDEQSGELSSGDPMGIKAGGQKNTYGVFAGGIPVTGYGDTGTASRFFYCAKPSTAERNTGQTDNRHPTVKAAELMAYFCRLVTPPGGTVLDPFAGSGSTGIGALREGFSFIGIEREAEYAEMARARIKGDAPLFNVEALT